jgi:hypothetical protein
LAITDFFIDCVRKRESVTLNDTRRAIKSYTSTSITGYVGKGNTKYVNVADKITTVMQYNFYCDDFDLIFGDIIVYENKNYEVISNPQNTTHKNHHIKAILQLIENVK